MTPRGEPPEEHVYPSPSTEILRLSDYPQAKPKMALDFDSTLVNTRVVAYKLMFGDDHDRDPAESTTWEWPIEEFGAARFLSGMWHTWTLRPLEAPPLEEGLAGTVAEFRDVFKVDIVTAHADHMGISEGKQEWLAHHGIEYDEFVAVPPTTTKAQMDYDVYIDDKPALPERVNEHNPRAQVYLIDWPYNRDAPGDFVRVNGVQEALRHLVWGTTAENPTQEVTTLD